MREYKFRAWVDNKMFAPFSFNNMSSLLEAHISHKSKVVIEQYTGLKDKNGKEIYEGDVVGKGCGEIYWDSSHQQFRVRWHERVFRHIRGRDGEPLFPSCDKAWEIVGNIHDNPELLTPLKGERINTMTTDPNVKAEEVKEAAAAIAPEEQATEETGNQEAPKASEGEGALVD